MNLLEVFGMTDDSPVTDESFRAVLARKRVVSWVLVVLGLVTGAAALLSFVYAWGAGIGDYNLGFFCGIGFGMAGGGVALLLRNRRVMADPVRFHAERVKYADERLREIARRAWVVAGLALLVALYLVGIIGGFFYPVLHTVLAVLAFVFLGTYSVTWFVLNRRM